MAGLVGLFAAEHSFNTGAPRAADPPTGAAAGVFHSAFVYIV